MPEYHPLIRFNIPPDSKPDNTATINRIARLEEEKKELQQKLKLIEKELDILINNKFTD